MDLLGSGNWVATGLDLPSDNWLSQLAIAPDKR
jgi:hypothetical protein